MTDLVSWAVLLVVMHTSGRRRGPKEADRFISWLTADVEELLHGTASVILWVVAGLRLCHLAPNPNSTSQNWSKQPATAGVLNTESILLDTVAESELDMTLHGQSWGLLGRHHLPLLPYHAGAQKDKGMSADSFPEADR